ncbi:hypothetical protein DICVIV_06225 [Dictyocaulus viviparus]|uniref:Uncharacterized protein n=1 Tax=Dictyocaulus viviparus TaxID=29172 RepID=A0A0D8XZF3_DICVI|nr:hypothetical protein DICVIV_06225 [Dictyocaulus viviparus]
MVFRPPIEKWSRVELEEHFHSAYQQLQAAQKRVSEQEKKINILNTRLRSSILDRSSKNDTLEEQMKFSELQKENKIMALKLKAVRHQILTYTAPSARSITGPAVTAN